MIPRAYRAISLLLFVFSVLLLGNVKEVAAQKKERVGRHSPAYMRSVLYLYNNIGHNIDIIFYLGKSEENQSLFGGFNIGQDHRVFDLDLFDYRGLVKRRPKTNHYAKIQKAIGLRSIIVIAIEGVDVSHYKAMTLESYPFDKESPAIKILDYTGGGKVKELEAISCRGLPPDDVHLILNLAPMDCGNIVLVTETRPAFNPDTGNFYGLASSDTVVTVKPKFIEWLKEEGLSVSPRGNLSVSWGEIKRGSDFSAP